MTDNDHSTHAFDSDSDCPECQILWAGMVDAMSRVGANVRVTLPPDIAPWWDESAFGASWVADVEGVNGDQLDVQTPDGDIEPVDIAYCRPARDGTFTSPCGAMWKPATPTPKGTP